MMRYLRVFGLSVLNTDLFRRGRSKCDAIRLIRAFFRAEPSFQTFSVTAVPPKKGRNRDPGRSDCDSRPRASHGWLLLALAASRDSTYLDIGSHSRSKIYGPFAGKP